MSEHSFEGSEESLSSLIAAPLRHWITQRTKCVLLPRLHFSLVSCCCFMPGSLLAAVTWAPSFDANDGALRSSALTMCRR
jgi:hypothetical protein